MIFKHSKIYSCFCLTLITFSCCELFAETTPLNKDAILFASLPSPQQIPSQKTGSTHPDVKWQDSPRASVKKGFTTHASFLYWQAREDRLEYAETVDSGFVQDIIRSKAKIDKLHFEWNPGFQVGLGYIFPEKEQWDFALNWTSFYSKAHGSAEKRDPNFIGHSIRPLWFSVLTGAFVDKASAHWTVHYNVLDLSLARSYYVGRFLIIKPLLGIRGAWIDQHYLAKYHAIYPNDPLVFNNNKFKADNDYAGVGLRLGSDLRWPISPHFSLVGNISGSVLYGAFRIHERINGFFQTTNILIREIFKEAEHLHRLNVNLESKIGLQWQTFFHRNRFRVCIGAFYDFSYWFNQNQLVNQIAVLDPVAITRILGVERNDGDLQLQGGRLEICFEF